MELLLRPVHCATHSLQAALSAGRATKREDLGATLAPGAGPSAGLAAGVSGSRTAFTVSMADGQLEPSPSQDNRSSVQASF